MDAPVPSSVARMQEPRVASAVATAREEHLAALRAKPPFPDERRDLPALISRALTAQRTPCLSKSVDESEATQIHCRTDPSPSVIETLWMRTAARPDSTSISLSR